MGFSVPPRCLNIGGTPARCPQKTKTKGVPGKKGALFSGWFLGNPKDTEKKKKNKKEEKKRKNKNAFGSPNVLTHTHTHACATVKPADLGVAFWSRTQGIDATSAVGFLQSGCGWWRKIRLFSAPRGDAMVGSAILCFGIYRGMSRNQGLWTVVRNGFRPSTV